MRGIARLNLIGVCTMVGLCLLWELLVGEGILRYRYLPAPTDIATGLWTVAVDGPLWPSLLHTVTVTLSGWVVSSLLGIGLGLALGLSRRTWQFGMASVEILRSLPSIAFVPVTILIFGYSATMELVIIIYVAQWPVLINTVGGIREVPPRLLDVARMLRLSRLERLRKCVLPAALPVIAVGLKLSLTLSLVLAVVAEMVGNPAGLGHELVFHERALQPEKMFAYILVVGLVGVLLNAGFTETMRRIPAAQYHRRT